MIRNFEEYTDELSEDEQKYILPSLAKLLILHVGKEKAITNKYIVSHFNKYFPIQKWIQDKNNMTLVTVKTSEPRKRHMIHILRVSASIPCLIATSMGYYISNDRKEIETYIGSIDDRLRAIYAIRKALKRQLKNWGLKQEGIQKELLF